MALYICSHRKERSERVRAETENAHAHVNVNGDADEELGGNGDGGANDEPLLPVSSRNMALLNQSTFLSQRPRHPVSSGQNRSTFPSITDVTSPGSAPATRSSSSPIYDPAAEAAVPPPSYAEHWEDIELDDFGRDMRLYVGVGLRVLPGMGGGLPPPTYDS